MSTTTNHAARRAVLAKPCQNHRDRLPVLRTALFFFLSPTRWGSDVSQCDVSALIQHPRHFFDGCKASLQCSDLVGCAVAPFVGEQPLMKFARLVGLSKFVEVIQNQRLCKAGNDFSIHRAPVPCSSSLYARLHFGGQSDLHLWIVTTHAASVNHSGLCGFLHSMDHRGLILHMDHRGLIF